MIRHKAFAYITQGHRLLVFTHPDTPDAGTQVPAGTIEHGETPADAVLREAQEETGLSLLTVVRFLGTSHFDMSPFGRDEVHERHFFHLRCDGVTPARWRNRERHPSEGNELPLFEFSWAGLPDGVPGLIAGHDALLTELLVSLRDDA